MTWEMKLDEKYDAGLREGIKRMITALRNTNCSDQEIVQQMVELYHLSEEEAVNYLKNN